MAKYKAKHLNTCGGANIYARPSATYDPGSVAEVTLSNEPKECNLYVWDIKALEELVRWLEITARILHGDRPYPATIEGLYTHNRGVVSVVDVTGNGVRLDFTPGAYAPGVFAPGVYGGWWWKAKDMEQLIEWLEETIIPRMI